ncbi:hypothetical protein [Arthrobacter sp. Bi83]|uniref:hypothetical protein n=1 Tax=Arthrobacter sp. Bi83 TaxID=2822353 RepID=UPI001E2F5916|nr:hypothetical protein [Arthrobacter sp. Bi83]
MNMRETWGGAARSGSRRSYLSTTTLSALSRTGSSGISAAITAEQPGYATNSVTPDLDAPPGTVDAAIGTPNLPNVATADTD